MLKIRRFVVPLSIVGSAVGFTVIFKDQFAGAKYKGEEKLHGRTVVITGTTSGLGKETARNLAKRGGRIVMGCRDLEKCQEVRNEIIAETFNKQVQCYKLDLASTASIREFAEQVNKNEQRVDILINNAGIMGMPERVVTHDGFESQLGINYLGPFLLTNLLLDKIKESAPSRIVNVTCVSLRQGELNFEDFNSYRDYDVKKAYCMSKLALYTFGMELADRLKGSRVTVYNVHPGICMTNIGQHMGKSKLQISRSLLYPIWWLILKKPEQGIHTTLYCALDPDEAYFTGHYYEECNMVQEVNIDSKVRGEAGRLWAVSDRWTRHVDE